MSLPESLSPSAPSARADLATPPLPSAPRRPYATGRTVLALMLREMSTTYGRSPGGYIWAILEPLGAIMLMTVVFSLFTRAPPIGTNFILFYATGFLPFALYQDTSMSVGRCISYSRALLGYPTVTWMDALLARFVLNSLTTIMAGYLILTVIMLVFETGAVIKIESILLSMTMAALLGLGVGSMNCVLSGLFPTWITIWSILNRPLFLISGIFLLYDDLPGWIRDIMWYNPLVHVIGVMRHGFYPMYAAAYVSYSYVFGIALTLTALGFLLLRRYYLDILNGD